MIITEIINDAAFHSLLWFALGIMVGREMLRKAPQKRSGGKRGRKPARQKSRKDGARASRRNGDGGSGSSTELYVGNLPYEATEKDVAKIFSKHGSVEGVRLIENRHNGKPKGFGFVEMGDSKKAAAAAKALNGSTFMGRSLVVNSAKSRERD